MDVRTGGCAAHDVLGVRGQCHHRALRLLVPEHVGDDMSVRYGGHRREAIVLRLPQVDLVAELLYRTVGTLQYIGVGYHDGNSGMYASDCLWFRVTGRDAETTNPVTLLEQLPSVDGELRREMLLDTQRDE